MFNFLVWFLMHFMSMVSHALLQPLLLKDAGN